MPADLRTQLKALEERADTAIKRISDGHGCMRIPVDSCDPDVVIHDLLRLTRALLVSQGELMKRVCNGECRCVSSRGRVLQECPRCQMIARAKRVRKGDL